MKNIEVKKSHDAFGPGYLITVSDASIGLTGYLVIDNTALGVGKGGCRMTPDVTLEEVMRLARTMTWKNAIAGIAFGGAKSGIVMPHDIDLKTKKLLVTRFAQMIKPLLISKYVMGPDVNSGEREMDWFVGAVRDKKAATGKSLTNGGLPHELGSTGFGVAHSTMTAMRLKGIDPTIARVAIEGFGNVGSFAFKFLKEWGVNVVAIADSRSTAYKEDGFEFEGIMKLRKSKSPLSAYPGAKGMSREAIFGLDVDVLIPATVTDVINDTNKSKVKASVIVEGANIPMKEEIEFEFHKRGILVVPDFVANAGGVISSYAEYRGLREKRMFEMVKEKVTKSTTNVIKRSMKENQPPRVVAVAMAQELVKK